MITFITGIILLVLGYIFYGRFVEKVFKPQESRPTPAYYKGDGVDYIPLSSNKNSFIQLLNIAGVGPIFGPILGALYGPVAFIWIVVGAIFAGAVHDYLTGMISVRNGGAHLPALASKFLGKYFSHVVNFFSVLLLLLVGTVFISAPAQMLHGLLGNQNNIYVWIVLGIFVYYILSTVLPIDKIIGRIYPILGMLLLLSALGASVAMFTIGNPIPELSFKNLHPEGVPYYPIIFLTISCGALSGFHATQSPIISRTIKNENEGRKIFYGMMIAEAIIAMIWAAAAMSLTNAEGLRELLQAGGPAAVVGEIAKVFLGTIGGTIAVLGVIVLPITSGDTSFRAARMILADYFNLNQKAITNRLLIAIPLFVMAFILTKIDFQMLWRYFSWANQATAAIALWISAVYLYKENSKYLIALIPAIFISSVLGSYLFYNSSIGFGFDIRTSNIVGIVFSIALTALFFSVLNKEKVKTDRL